MCCFFWLAHLSFSATSMYIENVAGPSLTELPKASSKLKPTRDSRKTGIINRLRVGASGDLGRAAEARLLNSLDL